MGGATLSPFRYAQVARYALQRWLDQTPNVVKSTWKGKGRATPVVATTPTGSRQAGSDSESDVSPGADSGPSSSTKPEKPELSGGSPGPSKSRIILQPDSRMPPQPTEIYRLMNDERLLEPGRRNAPKEIIVLCHGKSLLCEARVWLTRCRSIWILDSDTDTTVPFAEAALLGIGTGSTKGPDGM
jgi:triacylglycerol lipase